MDEQSSLDIDTKEDLLIADMFLSEQSAKKVC
jgi:CMP-N-acetylneuraminic acid synthetase